MSNALGSYTGSDIFLGKFSKITTKKVNKTSTEASLAPDSYTADYTNSSTYVHRVYCVVQLWPNAILPNQNDAVTYCLLPRPYRNFVYKFKLAQAKCVQPVEQLR